MPLTSSGVVGSLCSVMAGNATPMPAPSAARKGSCAGLKGAMRADAPMEALVNSLAMALPFDASEKQALLEAFSPDDRRAALIALMSIDSSSPPDGAPPSMQ